MNYEPLNRNRLIALLGVIFATTSPRCTIVTDSTTSEGLGQFLEEIWDYTTTVIFGGMPMLYVKPRK
jgi:hypothetical protein